METDPRAELIETLKLVVGAMKAAEVPFAVVGSFAGYARGAPPSDNDVDLGVCESDVDAAVAALTAVGLDFRDPPEDWLVKVYDEDRQVDLIHRLAGRPVTPELLAGSDWIEVASVSMPVLGATDLIIFKLLALGEHACDFGPLLAIVRAIREQVDWPRVAEETRLSPYAQVFLELARRLNLVSADEVPEWTEDDDERRSASRDGGDRGSLRGGPHPAAAG
ncbi:hypothetical protein [Allonocardiopsis opalescens]|uniref:Uncharacterized protein n=1 Tax=Allonocardiopsis opalescens TaxID=1144618 RepID=A0A2T0PX99_9ACTN|nr:hypothetical protein [Allonocardiopsis opalescens]PRX96149.1 hypothetical protein CLV72_108155 [Allonocardiopsis opalescens]